jgi:hypothetical protein
LPQGILNLWFRVRISPVAIFDGFSILGAIGELRGELLVWMAVKNARYVR